MCDLHYRREKRGAGVRPLCAFCGETFDQNIRYVRKFCSDECREKQMFIERTETHRERWLKRQFGLTVAQYDEMLESQGGACAICRTTEPKTNGNRSWCVDHDHETGRIRGLLCHDCNIGLGKFMDNPKFLEAALAYLRL